MNAFESRLHALRHVCVSGEGDLLDRLGFVRRALDVEPAGVPFEVLLGRLEQVSGDRACLLPQLACHHGGGGAGHRGAARGICTEPVGSGVGVALLDRDVGGRDSQLLGHDLRERRLVALTL